MHALGVNFHHIKTARWHTAKSQQVVLGSTDNAFLFHPSDTGRRAAMARAQSLAHLYKYQRSVRAAHDQIDLAAAAPRCPIITRQQTQAPVLQILQGLVLGGIADFFAARLRSLRPKETLA